MANTPNSQTVYQNAVSNTYDSRTPGMNNVISAWQSLQDFTGANAARQFNNAESAAALLRGLRA